MPSIHRFETKRGHCRFEDDALVFDESVRGYVRNLYDGYRRSDEWWGKWVFLAYVLAIPIGLFSLAAGGSEIGDPSLTFLALLVGAYGLLYAHQRFVRGFTNADRIPLDAVTAVSLTRGSKGLTRPRFVVAFEDGDERRRRYVLLPSLYLSHAEETLERAVAGFEERGFDVDRS